MRSATASPVAPIRCRNNFDLIRKNERRAAILELHQVHHAVEITDLLKNPRYLAKADSSIAISYGLEQSTIFSFFSHMGRLPPPYSGAGSTPHHGRPIWKGTTRRYFETHHKRNQGRLDPYRFGSDRQKRSLASHRMLDGDCARGAWSLDCDPESSIRHDLCFLCFITPAPRRPIV